MRQKIWYELHEAKYNSVYLLKYIDYQNQLKKRFDIATLLFSGTGILGWTIWSYFPVVSSGVIVVMQLFKLIENKIILRDKEIQSIDELRVLNIVYYQNLEKCWYLLEDDKDSINQVRETLFTDLNAQRLEMNKREGSLPISSYRKIAIIAETETKQLLKNIFY